MHADEVSPGGGLVKLLLIALGVALILPSGGAAASQVISSSTRVTSQQAYPEESWGLGVVVPDGSRLSGGSTVDWSMVTNVTTVIQIPDITNASAPVYAVMSLMTQNGAVLQTAFGVYPGQSSWLVYSMFIGNINEIPQHYTWVINSSEPEAEPGDLVTLSIYQSPMHVWSFTASNANSSRSVRDAFAANITQPLKRGDQEAFALESYASDSSTFKDMGNMTLQSLLVNGDRVTTGWYLFSDWDMLHNPLFVVGGGTPPLVVDYALLMDGRVIWYYAGSWSSGQLTVAGFLEVEMVILTGAALCGVLLSLKYIRRGVQRE